MAREDKCNNSELLFFILIFLMLFYDNRPIGILRRRRPITDSCSGNTELLFFILVFLLLFY